jgi:hypothetical protein
MSFADGFRSGFGLISDVQDRALQRDRLDEQARQGDLDRKSLGEYREGQLEIGRKRNSIDEQAQGIQQLKAENESKLRDIQLAQVANQKTQADADAAFKSAQKTSLDLKNKGETDRLSNIEKETKFAVNAQAFLDHLKVGGTAAGRDEGWYAKADKLFEDSYGGLTNPFNAINPANQENMVAFRKLLEAAQSGGDIDRGSVTPILNSFIGSSDERRVGTELTEENTPSAGHLNGKGWKIVSKEVAPDWNIANGQILATVDVTVQNAAGDTAVYNAPLSAKRAGVMLDENGEPVIDDATGKPKKAPPQPVAVDTLIDSAAGYYKYAQYADQFRNEITDSAVRLYNAQNGAGSFSKDVKQRISNFQTTMGTGTRGSEMSFVTGMTNAELALDAEKLERYMTHAVLDPAKNIPKATPAAESMLQRVSKIPEVQDLADDLGRSLSRSELLSASHYFSETTDPNTKRKSIGVKRDDRRSWDAFKRGLAKDEEMVPSSTGVSLVQDRFNQGGLRGL